MSPETPQPDAARDWVETRFPSGEPLADRVVRGRRRWQLAMFAVGFGGAAAVAVVLFLLVGFRDRLDPPLWLRLLGLVLIFAGVAIELWWIARTVRSGLAGANRRSPLWALPHAQRRLAVRRVLGRAPYAPDDVPFLRVVAAELAQRWMLGLFAGLTLVLVGQGISATTRLQLAIAACVLPVMLASGLLTMRRIRIAERFLERTAAAQRGASA